MTTDPRDVDEIPPEELDADAGQAVEPHGMPAFLRERWGWLSPEWLTTPPPPRRYLLRVGTDEKASGLLPLGRVGMLAAGGGAGKSWALTQLAVSVATGLPWFGTYGVSASGAVLLALAEEEPEEMRRRIHAAMLAAGRAGGLNRDALDAARARASANIAPLALMGEHVALTFSADELRERTIPPDSPEARETAFLRGLAWHLATARTPEGRPVEWRAIILDPVSRFAGPDVEVDNAAATRFVQAVERLTRAPGNPAVIVAHHTNKMSRIGTTDASAARGASGLTDGARWQANLDAVPSAKDPRVPVKGLAVLRVVKSNYAAFPDAPLWLERSEERDISGTLHPASREKVDAYAAEVKAEKAKRGNKGKAKAEDGDAPEAEAVERPSWAGED